MNKEKIVREVINKVREDKKLTDKEKNYLLCIGNDWLLLQQENQQLKKKIDDVANRIKVLGKFDGTRCTRGFKMMTADFNDLLRMLGEI